MSEAKTKELTPYQKRNQRIQGRGAIKIGNPKIKMAGQEIDVREWIQANNVDTDIYETLEKYGVIKTPKLGQEQYGEIATHDLRSAINLANSTKDLWENLPLDVRQEFNHNIDEFIEKGNKWAQNKMTQMKRETEQPKPEKPEKKVEEKKDEQK
ncbi:MAG: hypothetical protein LBJ25_00345 [Candidatus Margulisbacteria bacterium]|jgi:hypothetical protein|nr:hypothetical protein [Candidatus Margulisiibacteriota bacterium]